jgi:hypothetical protein
MKSFKNASEALVDEPLAFNQKKRDRYPTEALKNEDQCSKTKANECSKTKDEANENECSKNFDLDTKNTMEKSTMLWKH